MKATKNTIAKDGSGSITLTPEDPEDIWHAYNLIQRGDRLRSSAIRRVTRESASGSTQTDRVHTSLTITVDRLEFDAKGSELHVSGRVAEENNVVALGSFHTLDLELHRAFRLEKSEGWDSVSLQQLKEAVEERGKAGLWAVMLEEGAANICVVTEFQTKLVQHLVGHLPRKRTLGGAYDKAVGKFHKLVFTTLARKLELDTVAPADVPAVLLAGPGYHPQNFKAFIEEEAMRGSSKSLRALVKNITVTHASSSNLGALAEVMSSRSVASTLQNTKFTRETQLLDRFYESIRRDDGKARYGFKEVLECIEQGAVGRGGGVLLISNNLFRNQDVAERRKWVALVDRVRKVEGGEVRVLSEAHESGKRLEAIGGIAALLTYPIYEFDEEAEDGEDTGENT